MSRGEKQVVLLQGLPEEMRPRAFAQPDGTKLSRTLTILP